VACLEGVMDGRMAGEVPVGVAVQVADRAWMSHGFRLSSTSLPGEFNRCSSLRDQRAVQNLKEWRSSTSQDHQISRCSPSPVPLAVVGPLAYGLC
jgi:hypothetical protein